MHALEVGCIGKGKAHKCYEFGVKASFAVTNRISFVVGLGLKTEGESLYKNQLPPYYYLENVHYGKK